MCVCVHPCVDAHVCICVYVLGYGYGSLHVCVHMCVSMSLSVYVRAVCNYIYMCGCLCGIICACMCAVVGPCGVCIYVVYVHELYVTVYTCVLRVHVVCLVHMRDMCAYRCVHCVCACVCTHVGYGHV